MKNAGVELEEDERRRTQSIVWNDIMETCLGQWC